MKNETLADLCLLAIMKRYGFFSDKFAGIPLDARELLAAKMNPTRELVDGKWHEIESASQSSCDWECYKY